MGAMHSKIKAAGSLRSIFLIPIAIFAAAIFAASLKQSANTHATNDKANLLNSPQKLNQHYEKGGIAVDFALTPTDKAGAGLRAEPA